MNSFGRLGHGQDRHRFTPTIISTLKNIFITQVACGDFHTGAVTNEGRVYTWGKGDDGRLGHNSEQTQLEPKLVEALSSKKVIHLDCGYVASAAVTGIVFYYSKIMFINILRRFWRSLYLGRK